MKKLFFTFFAISALFAFSACGSDDDDPVDYTLYDKSEIVGDQSGKVNISLTSGKFTAYDGQAETKFLSSNNNNLSLFVGPPNEIGGPINSTNFMKSTDGTHYTFNIDIAAYGTIEKTGNSIPTYINEWYKDQYEVSKIIIKNMSSKNAKYDKASKSISFEFSGALEIYEGGNKVADNTIVYKFTELTK